MPDAPRRRGTGRAAAARPPAPGAATAPDTGDAPAEPARPNASKRGTARTLSDGRVQMLVYLPPTIVRAIKHAAVEEDTSASHVVEQALAHWLARSGNGKHAPPERP